jgi:hypothetical protein
MKCCDMTQAVNLLYLFVNKLLLIFIQHIVALGTYLIDLLNGRVVESISVI